MLEKIAYCPQLESLKWKFIDLVLLSIRYVIQPISAFQKKIIILKWDLVQLEWLILIQHCVCTLKFIWQSFLCNNKYPDHPPLNWNYFTHVIHMGSLGLLHQTSRLDPLPKSHKNLYGLLTVEYRKVSLLATKRLGMKVTRGMKWMMKCKTGHLCLCGVGGIAIITYSSGQRKRKEEVWTLLRI